MNALKYYSVFEERGGPKYWNAIRPLFPFGAAALWPPIHEHQQPSCTVN